MDIPIEHEEIVEADDVLIESEDEDDSAPEETKTTFWGNLTEFVSALLTGIPG